MQEEINPFSCKVRDIYNLHTILSFLSTGTIRIFCIITITTFCLFLLFISKYTFIKNYKNTIIKYYCLLLLYFLGFKKINISKEDIEKIQKSESNIIISNHSSFIDILLLIYLIPDVKFVIDKSLKLPIFETYLNDFTIKSDDCINEIKNSKKIVYFSEGCLSRSDILLKLKDDAFKLKENILPIYIKYPEESNWIDSNQNIFDYIVSHISKRNNNVEIKILDDYKLNNDDKVDIDVFIENFREYYSSNTNIKLSNFCYKDHPYNK